MDSGKARDQFSRCGGPVPGMFGLRVTRCASSSVALTRQAGDRASVRCAARITFSKEAVAGSPARLAMRSRHHAVCRASTSIPAAR